MEQFGDFGLEIYRYSLEKYFKEKNSDILYYDISDKAVNYFSDFYLLEEIKKVICGVLKSAVGESESDTDTGYDIKNINIPTLVEYFIAESSKEHKVLIDQDIQLIEKAHELMDPEELSSEEPWTSLQESINKVYNDVTPSVHRMISQVCRDNGVAVSSGIYTKIDIKEIIVSLAKNSLLSQQKKIEEETKRIKQVVLFFRKKQIPFITREESQEEKEDKKEFYKRPANWLEG